MLQNANIISHPIYIRFVSFFSLAWFHKHQVQAVVSPVCWEKQCIPSWYVHRVTWLCQPKKTSQICSLCVCFLCGLLLEGNELLFDKILLSSLSQCCLIPPCSSLQLLKAKAMSTCQSYVTQVCNSAVDCCILQWVGGGYCFINCTAACNKAFFVG